MSELSTSSQFSQSAGGALAWGRFGDYAPTAERRLSARTVFLSDLHLGFHGARAQDLHRLLERLDCSKLYLVGDVIDLWQLHRGWHWNSACEQVVSRLLAMAREGVEVIFIPGNHDDRARRYAGLEVGRIPIRELDVHTTADGRRLLVTHGDQFDLVIQHSRWLGMLGALAYGWLVRLNQVYNAFRRLRRKPYWSLAQYIKLRVKSACTYISRFEEAVLGEARRQNLDGVVCGHIHKAEIRHEVEGTYYNCGDWIESCTLIVEHEDGRMELVDGLETLAELEGPTSEPAEEEVSIPRSA